MDYCLCKHYLSCAVNQVYMIVPAGHIVHLKVNDTGCCRIRIYEQCRFCAATIHFYDGAVCGSAGNICAFYAVKIITRQYILIEPLISDCGSIVASCLLGSNAGKSLSACRSFHIIFLNAGLIFYFPFYKNIFSLLPGADAAECYR